MPAFAEALEKPMILEQAHDSVEENERLRGGIAKLEDADIRTAARAHRSALHAIAGTGVVEVNGCIHHRSSSSHSGHMCRSLGMTSSANSFELCRVISSG